jgi:hypothetical protein
MGWLKKTALRRLYGAGFAFICIKFEILLTIYLLSYKDRIISGGMDGINNE